MTDRDAAPGVIEAQMRAWGAELDRLRARAEKELAEVRKEYYDHIGELRDDIAAQLKKWAKEIEALEPAAGARTALRDLRAKIEAELARWEPEIEALRRSAGRAEADARQLTDDLKAQRKAMTAKLSELRHASGAAWEDVRAGATRAWEELKPALQSAIAKFK